MENEKKLTDVQDALTDESKKYQELANSCWTIANTLRMVSGILEKSSDFMARMSFSGLNESTMDVCESVAKEATTLRNGLEKYLKFTANESDAYVDNLLHDNDKLADSVPNWIAAYKDYQFKIDTQDTSEITVELAQKMLRDKLSYCTELADSIIQHSSDLHTAYGNLKSVEEGITSLISQMNITGAKNINAILAGIDKVINETVDGINIKDIPKFTKNTEKLDMLYFTYPENEYGEFYGDRNYLMALYEALERKDMHSGDMIALLNSILMGVKTEC